MDPVMLVVVFLSVFLYGMLMFFLGERSGRQRADELSVPHFVAPPQPRK